MRLTPFRMQNGLPSGTTPQAREAREKASELVATIESYGERYTGTGGGTVSHGGTEINYRTVPDKVHGDEIVDNAPQRSETFDGVSQYDFSVSPGSEFSYTREGDAEMFSQTTNGQKTSFLRDHTKGIIAQIWV